MANDKKPVDRETLYNEVWAEPVSIVAPRYGLSDVGLAKICRSLAIPLPSRGYWAKVKAGRIMAKASLPQLKQSGPVTTGLSKLDSKQATDRERTKKATSVIRREVEQFAAEEPSGPPHPLIVATSKRLRQRDGWEKNALLRAAPKEVINISVTLAELDRALGIADALLKTLAKHGFDCEIKTERGITLLRQIETGAALELTLSEYVRRSNHEPTPAEEKARNGYWARARLDASLSFPTIPRYDYTPTGVLTLQIGHHPSKSWKDTPITKLERRLGEIVSGIFALAKETHDKNMAEARRQDAERKALELYEFFTKRRASEVERFNNLEASANNWERAARIRAYAAAVEDKARATGELSEMEMDWLTWAQAKADCMDPLIQVSDPILDAPERKKPGYW
jgi:hypothetical protein